MAIVRTNVRLDMTVQDVWYGTVTRADATTIEITAGDAVARYTGSFSYDEYNVYGQLRGYAAYFDGALQGTVSGLNVDAYWFSEALDYGDTSAIYQMMFRGADQFYGSNFGDRLLGFGGADVMRGGGGNDVLQGGAGADVLHAGTGYDVLIGGAGADRLHGGTDGNSDSFVFSSRFDSTSSARDVVFNFTRGSDHIDLRGMDARTGTPSSNDAFSWAGKTAQAHSVWWAQSENGVLLRGDVNGDRQADFEIHIWGPAALGSDDVML